MMILDRARPEPFAFGFCLSAITFAVHALAAALLAVIWGGDGGAFGAGVFVVTALGLAFELRGLARAYQHRSCPTGVGVLALFCLVATVLANFFLMLVLPVTVVILACAINGSVYVAPHEDDG